MTLTEDQAKTKWCPMVRYVPARKFSFGRIKVAVNRWLDSDETQLSPMPSCCIGSDCMAWRWECTGAVGYFADGTAVEGDHKESGYCGLAGKP